MAHQSVDLSESDRNELSRIIDAIGLSQKKLADLSDVTQPWLSQVLTGRRENVDGEMLERVAAQLAERLKNLPPDVEAKWRAPRQNK